ncbi:unnamed protein product [Fructobacillus fructosus]|uniref:hypothetical protein n=1 Tax=Fructobacillus fructosus TaxID=1631 RepID=UPI002DAFD233|nr:unnamed protein product [Fructobacillus fructosus]
MYKVTIWIESSDNAFYLKMDGEELERFINWMEGLVSADMFKHEEYKHTRYIIRNHVSFFEYEENAK